MREKGMTTITLKKINRDKVYQYIYQQKETSKLQIVQDLQMGLSTVSQNLNELEADGLISRDGYFESTGGRKAQIIRIIEDFRISIGLGIMKDMFHIVAVNLYGDAIATETISLAYENSASYYTELAGHVEHFIKDHQYTPEKIEGISIATQGIISPDGTAVTYGDIMGNMQMKISDFSSRLPYPCHLEHDSKAAAGMPVKEFFSVLHTAESPTLRKIWQDYLDHLAFAICNLNLVIDSPVIISGYLAPYFQEADMQYLLEKINERSLFEMTADQLVVGNHGQYTPAIGAAIYYIKKFLEPSVS